MKLSVIFVGFVLVMPVLSSVSCELSIIIEDQQCTTIIAMGDVTKDGSTVIAKNRDLSENSCQHFHVQPREKPNKPMVKCQYIFIPQVNETYSWVGAKTYNKWGIGMGINEFNVSILDNDADTREELEGKRGLHDNDLCRLVLERSRSAEEGVSVLTSLVEEYGQAASGEMYTIADPDEVWIVETTNRHWAAKKIEKGIEVRANQYQITDDWDMASEDVVEFAVKNGWANEKDFSFAEAYTEEWPSRYSQIRYERANELLRGNVEIWDVIDVLQDRYEKTELCLSEERPICVNRTAGVMAVKYLDNRTEVLFSFSSPCSTPLFIPFYNGYLSLPDSFEVGNDSYNEDSAWWHYERLQRSIDEDCKNRTWVSNILEITSKKWYSEFTKIAPGEEAMNFTYSKASDALILLDNLYHAICYKNDPATQ
jgi:dipeptidase